MAGNTLRRHRGELAGPSPFVAVVTQQGGMRPHEREAVVVPSHGLYGGLPALHGVAILAASPKPAVVNVGVAVCALITDIGKDQTDVALRTRDTGVHTPQWVARLAVIELDDVTEGLPGCEGVATVAGDVQVTVWTASVWAASVLLGEYTPRYCEYEEYV